MKIKLSRVAESFDFIPFFPFSVLSCSVHDTNKRRLWRSGDNVSSRAQQAGLVVQPEDLQTVAVLVHHQHHAVPDGDTPGPTPGQLVLLHSHQGVVRLQSAGGNKEDY